jgi:hypothetical protein
MAEKVKVSDAIWVAAEAVVAMAAKSGVKLTIGQVYTKETVKNLAFLAGLIVDQVGETTGKRPEVLNT